MRKMVFGAALVLAFGAQAFAAALPCDTLKTKIEDGLKAKGVQGFTLTVVGTSETGDGKVVGSCEGGTKKIVYARGEVKAPAAKPDKADEKKPTAAK